MKVSRLAILVCLTLALALTGCGQAATPEPTATAVPPTMTPVPPTATPVPPTPTPIPPTPTPVPPTPTPTPPFAAIDLPHPDFAVYSLAAIPGGRLVAQGAIRNGARCKVYIWDGQQWQDVSPDRQLLGLAENQDFFIGEVVVSADGSIWMASNEAVSVAKDDTRTYLIGGVLRYNEGSWTFFKTGDTHGLAVDTDGTVWASSVQLSFFDGTAWRQVRGAPCGGTSHALALGPAGQIWIAWGRGLSWYDGREPIATACPTSVRNCPGWHIFTNEQWGPNTACTAEATTIESAVGQIAVARNGVAWAGGREAGLHRFDGASWTALGVEDGLPDVKIQALAMGPDDSLWVGTPKGLARFDGQKWEVWTSKDGLPADSIVAVAVDGQGVVWAAAYTGISRLRK